jgi:hypothetical protein
MNVKRLTKTAIFLTSIAGFIIISLYFLYGRIGSSGTRESDTLVYYADTLFGAQVIVISLLGLAGFAYGLIRNKRLAGACLSLLIAILFLVTPAATIQGDKSYYRAGDGGPAGAEFDCLVWDNPFKYGSFWYEPTCVTMHIPGLNISILNAQESYYLEAGPFYIFTLIFSELLLLGAPYFAYTLSLPKKKH